MHEIYAKAFINALYFKSKVIFPAYKTEYHYNKRNTEGMLLTKYYHHLYSPIVHYIYIYISELQQKCKMQIDIWWHILNNLFL